MKKLLTFAFILSLISPCFAGEMICYYPKSCKQIVSTEYSTGGSKKLIHYIELDCITNEGQYVKYTDKIIKKAGFLGLGRLTIPDKIIFIKWNKDELQCK